MQQSNLSTRYFIRLVTTLIVGILVACSSAEPETAALPAVEPTEPPVAEVAAPTAEMLAAAEENVEVVQPEPTMAAPATPTPIPVEVVADSGDSAAEPTDVPEPTAVPTETPLPEPMLNGLPVSSFIVMPPEVVENARQIYAAGQARGRNRFAFSKIGDSVIVNADFLTRFDDPTLYNLGPYEEQLRPIVDHYPGSYKRFGVGMRVGLRAWGVFDPLWADKDWCEPNEVMFDCEIRLNNPSVLLIHLGTNDNGPTFETFLRQLIEESVDAGVIPVIITKADRFEGQDNLNNRLMRQIAADLKVPMIDFDILAETLPNRGLMEDNIHLNGPNVHDYSLDEIYEYGHTVHNLAVLLMLEQIVLEVVEPSNS